MLSRRLNAFVIPISQRTVSGYATQSVRMISTSVPVAMTTATAVIWPPSFAQAGSGLRSSTRPTAKTIAQPAKRPARLLSTRIVPAAARRP